MKRLTLLLLVVVAVLISACQSFDELEKLDDADYDAEYAVPLLNTELSLREALENFQDLAIITIDPDGLIHFTYSGDVLTQNSDTIFAKINESLSGIPIPITSKRMALPLTLYWLRAGYGQGDGFDAFYPPPPVQPAGLQAIWHFRSGQWLPGRIRLPGFIPCRATKPIKSTAN